MSDAEPTSAGPSRIDESPREALPEAARPLARQGIQAAVAAAESQAGYLGALVNLRVVESDEGDSIVAIDVTPNSLS